MQRQASLFALLSLPLGLLFSQPAQEKAFKPGEKLVYRVHYGFVDAGEAILEVKERTTFNQKDVYRLIGQGYSVGAFNFFFKVRDRFESYVDVQSGLPQYFSRRTDEGGFIINQDYIFNQTNHTVKSKRSGSDRQRNGENLFQVSENMHDILSAFYHARNFDLSKVNGGEWLKVDTFFDEEIFPMQFKVVGRETIKTKIGRISCIAIRPVLQKGRVFKDEEDLTLWVSDDKNKIPVRLEAKVLVGSIRMDLKSAENLLHTLAKE